MSPRLQRITSWIALALGVTGGLLWAFAVREQNGIALVWPLFWIWLAIMGFLKARSVESQRDPAPWSIRRRRWNRSIDQGGRKHA